MIVLGIETSCDETSAAVLRGRRILSNIVSSQIELHKVFAGVVPELASRAHMERLPAVIEKALKEAFGKRGRLPALGKLVDAVAFTQGPGLAGALLIGKVAAESLAQAHGLPIVGVNHLEAHALAQFLVKEVPYPFMSLIVSGGHTEIVHVKGAGKYKVLGRTRDDAVGEVFDKVAKFLRLGYPGGPVIDRLSKQGRPDAVNFTRPLLPGTFDFSFSGIKTAVLYYVRDQGYAGKDNLRPAVPTKKKLPKKFVADLVASFQEAVVDTLIEKTMKAAAGLRLRRVVVGGGVAANSRLREKFASRGRVDKVKVYFPPMALCTDNAAMVAYVGSLMLSRKGRSRPLSVDPSMTIRSWR